MKIYYLKLKVFGKVNVMVTYSETNEVVSMVNETYSSSNTEEKDSNGGTRKISESDTKKEIIKDNNNMPVTQKIVLPKIEGAIVTASGANDINVKSKIIQAVCAVTGLPNYRIQVFEMENVM